MWFPFCSGQLWDPVPPSLPNTQLEWALHTSLCWNFSHLSLERLKRLKISWNPSKDGQCHCAKEILRFFGGIKPWACDRGNMSSSSLYWECFLCATQKIITGLSVKWFLVQWCFSLAARQFGQSCSLPGLTGRFGSMGFDLSNAELSNSRKQQPWGKVGCPCGTAFQINLLDCMPPVCHVNTSVPDRQTDTYQLSYLSLCWTWKLLKIHFIIRTQWECDKVSSAALVWASSFHAWMCTKP